MAEFPGFGQHCSVETCNMLDFLPVRCDACDKVFCSSHYTYAMHSCNSTFKKNVQVPVCQLCGKLIPVAKGEAPDFRVSEHIDTDCKSSPALALKGKIYANKCSLIGCKKRELIPLHCSSCRKNYCIRHRLPPDHDCGSKENATKKNSKSDGSSSKVVNGKSDPRARVSSRRIDSQQPSDSVHTRSVEESDDRQSKNLTTEEQDRILAEHLQALEYNDEETSQHHRPDSDVRNRCVIS